MSNKIELSAAFRLVCFLSACLAITAAAPAAAIPAGPPDGLLPETRAELNLARQATARYHNIETAIADGYVDIGVFFPNMGHHFLKPELLDETFDPEQPELLVYADFGTGRLRLVAVEYAVPTALLDTAPEGFIGEADHWHRNTAFGLWTLHAWIWHHNPNGVFADYNTRVP